MKETPFLLGNTGLIDSLKVLISLSGVSQDAISDNIKIS